MPGLQLGQEAGLSGLANTQSTSYVPDTPDALSFNGDLTSMGANPTYQSIASSLGMEMPQGFGGSPQGWLGKLNQGLANNSGLLTAGAGLLTSGFGAYNGMQQNKLLKANMQQQSNQFNQQLALQKQSYNSSLEDRQRARVASNATAYESVDSYMKKYGAK